VRHLRPLAEAANIIQSAFCRLDTVLLTFGYLMVSYKAMIDPDDLPGVPAIMKSIEARWAKADQEIFIAAMILNPFYRREPLVATPMFNNAGITALLGRVFKRLRRTTEVPQEFYIELSNYLNLQGTYSNLKLQLRIETNHQEKRHFLFFLF
jgi:hypothetical protein